MDIVYLLIGLLVGSIVVYLLLRPKINKVSTINHSIEDTNKELEKQNNILTQEKIIKTEQLNKLQKDYLVLDTKKSELNRSLQELKEIQKKAAEDYYSQALSIAENSFENEIDRISDDLFQKREEAKNLYLQATEEMVQEYLEAIEEKEKEFSYWNERIIALQKDVQIALEAAQRKMEIENQTNYYRICLSDEDITEIKRLREVLPYLRDKTPLNKVIYKVYYERPLTDMIGRVVGTGIHTGIYKITNIDNHMCYVGQAVNIADRWKQHCKRGVGAEDWTQNKLYPAMYSLGVENFTFEIIEECDRANLNQREDYWQNYFHAKDFGYSIK